LLKDTTARIGSSAPGLMSATNPSRRADELDLRLNVRTAIFGGNRRPLGIPALARRQTAHQHTVQSQTRQYHHDHVQPRQDHHHHHPRPGRRADARLAKPY
jgi:hypothetical protein